MFLKDFLNFITFLLLNAIIIENVKKGKVNVSIQQCCLSM